MRGAQRFNELAVDGYITPSGKVWSATDGITEQLQPSLSGNVSDVKGLL